MATITTGGLVEHSKKKDEEEEWKDTKAQLQSQTYMHRKPVTGTASIHSAQSCWSELV